MGVSAVDEGSDLECSHEHVFKVPSLNKIYGLKLNIYTSLICIIYLFMGLNILFTSEKSLNFVNNLWLLFARLFSLTCTSLYGYYLY